MSDDINNPLREKIGVGRINYNKSTKDKSYSGTMPFGDKTKVYVIERNVFSQMVTNGMILLKIII